MYFKNNSILTILLAAVTFFATTNQLIASEEQKEVRTLKQTWSKVIKLKWRSLDKEDAWNMLQTTIAAGCIAGVGYSAYHGINKIRRDLEERRNLIRAQRLQREYDMQRRNEQRAEFVPAYAGYEGNDFFWQDNNVAQEQNNNDHRLHYSVSNKVIRTEYCALCSVGDEEEDEKYNVTKRNILACNHSFCLGCLQEAVDIALKERNFPLCPSQECKHQLTEKEVCLIKNNDQHVRDLYDETNYKQFVKSGLKKDESAVFCPGANCKMLWVRNNNEGRISMICSACRTRFCSGCQHDHDQRITCEQAEQEQITQTNNWIQENTKPCPRCNNRIEKNEGCNHMTCKCGYEFCWTCLQKFDEQAYHDHNFHQGGCTANYCATQKIFINNW